MVASYFELYLGMRQQAQAVPDVQRNGHLTFARYLHGITPSSKGNTMVSVQQGEVLHRGWVHM
jgi:hypothetical protein